VTDTGAGMDLATQARLFEPFFSTKAAGLGTGLGLAIVYGIVKQLGGHIQVTSAPQQGSTFDLYFPASDEAAVPLPAQPAAAVEVGRETILLVEDDAGVLTLVSTVLSRHGYRVLAAATPAAALALVAAGDKAIDLILTDVVMPGMTGPMLVERLDALGCSRVIYMSGYAESEVAGKLLDERMVFLRKPFKQSDLLACVRRVMDSPRQPVPQSR
ncbi:MAG: response regulator, partial [Luteitalea sp.]|nr:response regulator [Luteitalea sp.]